MNIAILIGRLTADPELKTTPSGVSVCSFSIAVDRGYGDNRQTDFINIVAWRGSAEFVSKYFKKGDLIGIEGSIQTRKYTDRNGNSRTITEVIANNVEFVGGKQRDTNTATQTPQTAGGTVNLDIDCDIEGDMPF